MTTKKRILTMAMQVGKKTDVRLKSTHPHRTNEHTGVGFNWTDWPIWNIANKISDTNPANASRNVALSASLGYFNLMYKNIKTPTVAANSDIELKDIINVPITIACSGVADEVNVLSDPLAVLLSDILNKLITKKN